MPVAFECRRYLSIAVSSAREIILGRIEMAHVCEDIIDLETYYSDSEKLDAVGRMGGDAYSMTRQVFDLPTPSVEEVFDRQHGHGSLAEAPIAAKRHSGSRDLNAAHRDRPRLSPKRARKATCRTALAFSDRMVRHAPESWGYPPNDLQEHNS